MRISMAPPYLLIILLLISINLSAQTDYSQTANWYYHPEKPINLIANYDLDKAFINPDLSIDSTLTFPNQTETNTGVDVFWVHPTQLTDPPNFPTNIALADQPFALIASTILAQGALLGKYGRFYAPRYQPARPAAFLDASYSEAERAAARKGQSGTGERSEKVRVYRYQDGIVADQRLETKLQLRQILFDGDLSTLMAALIEQRTAQRLADL